jgi:hypothetical protein
MKMRMLTVLALASAFTLGGVLAAHADDFDQATLVNFSTAVRVPDQTLPAGSYWFVLIDHGENPMATDQVQIFNADRTNLIGTYQTAFTQRMRPSDDAVLTLAESENASESPTLVKWFYAGNTIGHEFMYSGDRQRELRREREVAVSASHVVKGQ